MNGRTPAQRYVDPLDAVWLAAASRMGLLVVRSDDAFAATDGHGVITIGTDDTLDADDCLAQMVLHEVCHWIVQGPDAVRTADWGLCNQDSRDLVREHACLRLQASLAGAYGLRRVLAPTTEHRSFHDALPADPLLGDDPSARQAREARERAGRAPWAPHLQAALAATRVMAELAGAADRPGDLWVLLDPLPPGPVES